MAISTKAKDKTKLFEMIRMIEANNELLEQDNGIKQSTINLMKTFKELLKFDDLKNDELKDIKEQIIDFNAKFGTK